VYIEIDSGSVHLRAPVSEVALTANDGRSENVAMTKPKSAQGRGWENPPEITLDARGRRAVLEPLLVSETSESSVVQDIEIILSIGVAHERPNVAGRRRLLDELIVATDRVGRALLDLDAATWDDLTRDVDQQKISLPFEHERWLVKYAEREPRAKKAIEAMVEHGYRVVPPAVPAALTEIARAAREQRDRLKKAETRGKLPLAMRDNAIRRLAEVFHAYTTSARDYRGRMIDFLAAALRAAKLPVPKHEDKVWTLVPLNFRKARKGAPMIPPKYPTLAEFVAMRRQDSAVPGPATRLTG
jgi:hypothetical protein